MKSSLEALRIRYDTDLARALDPIAVPLRFTDPMDRELAAFVAAHLAYGKVAPMLRAIEKVLAPLGGRPAGFLRQRDEQAIHAELEEALRGWVWRFHTSRDMVHWLLAWKRLDLESGAGLEAHLLPSPSETADQALSRLVQRLRAELPQTYGLRFNLPDPLANASCKRWRMFLRWMVDGWPDFGLWTRYPKDHSSFPWTPTARIARHIGLTIPTVDGRMAAEITASLKTRPPRSPEVRLRHRPPGHPGDCPACAPCRCKPCPLGACWAGRL